MKKMILAALAVAFCVTGASADAIRMKHIPVKFRTNAAALIGGFVDSTVSRRVGAAGASSVLDTTAGISTDGWFVPNGYPLLADTTANYFKLFVFGSTDGADDGCESAADSMACAVQVSADGKAWLTAAAIPGQTISAGTNPIGSRNNQTIVNGAFMDRLTLNGASLANGQPVWTWGFNNSTLVNTVIDRANLMFWPYIRFVFSLHDAKGYKIQAKVVALVGEDSPN